MRVALRNVPNGQHVRRAAAARDRRMPTVQTTPNFRIDPSTVIAGTMMDVPLTIGWILEHAVRNHARREIVSRGDDGELFRYTYADFAQRVARLGVVLKQLRPKCRAAVELRFTHELSYREIAAHLGVSQQMAKKYVAQALGHCRRRMAALG